MPTPTASSAIAAIGQAVVAESVSAADEGGQADDRADREIDVPR